jgi:methyl-accepting chemotaxis protein
MNFNNFRIAVRLRLGFLLVLALTALMTGIGVWRLHEINDSAGEMTERYLVTERLASEWATIIKTNGILAVSLVKSDKPDDVKYFKEEMARSSVRASEIETAIEALTQGGQGREVLDAMQSERQHFNAVRNDVFAIKEHGDDAAALAALGSQLLPAMKLYSEKLAALVSFERAQIDGAAKGIETNYGSGRNLLVGLGLLALALGLVVAWRLGLGITRPLEHAVAAARAVASGNLTGRIAANGTDEIAQLLNALQEMSDSLLRTVRDVHAGSDSIAQASSQIATGNQDLSARTEQQASSLQETASALEELTSTVDRNAADAQRANELAAAASRVAVEGGDAVGQVVRTMGSISEASERIVQIIGVIDGIAFQTNILALNAAVEAARAGEQGRGFAVVASEVRSLAQRSATAANEIKSLIGDSVNRVASGTQLVEAAGVTMRKIVSSVREVTDIVTGISAATRAQSEGIGEINRAVSQMDQVTQQNAALVEEAAAAAASLKEQASRWTQVVGVFQV